MKKASEVWCEQEREVDMRSIAPGRAVIIAADDTFTDKREASRRSRSLPLARSSSRSSLVAGRFFGKWLNGLSNSFFSSSFGMRSHSCQWGIVWRLWADSAGGRGMLFLFELWFNKVYGLWGWKNDEDLGGKNVTEGRVIKGNCPRGKMSKRRKCKRSRIFIWAPPLTLACRSWASLPPAATTYRPPVIENGILP